MRSGARPRRGRSRRIGRTAGRAVLAAGGLVGVVALIVVASYTAAAPDERTDLGFAAVDIVSPPNAPHEFRADLQVDVDMRVSLLHPIKTLRNLACAQPVTVTAVFSGSKEMWRRATRANAVDRAGHAGTSRVNIGVSDSADDITLRAAEGELGNLAPSSERTTSGETYMDARLQLTARPKTVTDIPGVDARESLVKVQTATMHKWTGHRAPVVVKFTAPWTSFRAFGSCYVQLPRLIRSDAGYTAALQRPSDELGNGAATYARVTDGLTRLDTDGAVLPADSQPEPTASGAVEGLFERHDATWSCHDADFNLGIDIADIMWTKGRSAMRIPRENRDDEESLNGELDLATSPPLSAFAALESSRSCQAVAAISSPQAGWLQVVLLLLVGAVFTPLALLFWKAGVKPFSGWVRRRSNG